MSFMNSTEKELINCTDQNINLHDMPVRQSNLVKGQPSVGVNTIKAPPQKGVAGCHSNHFE